MDLVHKISLLRSSLAARPAAEWAGLASSKLPGFINAGLVILIAWYAAKLAWALLPQQGEFDWSVRSPAPSTMAPSPSGSSTTDYNAIAQAHLFGIPGAAPVVAEEQSTDAPDTSLNLKLRGTIAANDADIAHAIIADGKGNDDVYFINDQIPGGATLKEIYPDRVILNRAGKLEALRLPKLSESLGRQTSPAPARAAAPAPTRSTAAQIRSGNAGGFMSVFRPQPFMPNGEMRGYRVYPGRDRRKFAELGFRPGDLVTAINGQQINDLQNGPMEIFGELDTNSSLSFTVERSGNPVVLTLDSEQLNSFTEPD